MRSVITFIDGQSVSYSNSLLTQLFPYFKTLSADTPGCFDLDFTKESFADLLDNQRFISAPKLYETSLLAGYLDTRIKHLEIFRYANGRTSDKNQCLQ